QVAVEAPGGDDTDAAVGNEGAGRVEREADVALAGGVADVGEAAALAVGGLQQDVGASPDHVEVDAQHAADGPARVVDVAGRHEADRQTGVTGGVAQVTLGDHAVDLRGAPGLLDTDHADQVRIADALTHPAFARGHRAEAGEHAGRTTDAASGFRVFQR